MDMTGPSRLSAVLLILASTLGLGAFFLGSSTNPASAQFWFGDQRQQYPQQDRYRQRRPPPPPPQSRFPFFGGFGGGWGNDWNNPPPQVDTRPARPAPVESTRPPAPTRKVEADPNAANIVVLGDTLADWLAFGLEDAFSDSAEFSVVRKNRPNSGLIRNDVREGR
jgi:uncharacterized protein